jgi:hypothetical protein
MALAFSSDATPSTTARRSPPSTSMIVAEPRRSPRRAREVISHPPELARLAGQIRAVGGTTAQ